jgi:hypothetical protein
VAKAKRFMVNPFNEIGMDQAVDQAAKVRVACAAVG